MDPRVLMFLSNTNGMSLHEKELNEVLIRLYIGGLIEAQWQNGEPTFSITVSGREEYMLAYAYNQQPFEA
jgi:hypothetical protein